jgi:hypothetical protein
MAIDPLLTVSLTKNKALSPGGPASINTALKTIHDIFHWLRSLAATPQEKMQIDAEEKEFLKAYGDYVLSGKSVTPNGLVAWVLYGVSPFEVVGNSTPKGRAFGALKKILMKHIQEEKSETLDRILYLLRAINHDKVDMKGRPRPPVEPAKRDARSYHAGYNDRTAYRIEHGQGS